MRFFPLHFTVFALLLSATGRSLPLQAALPSPHNIQSFASDVISGDDAGALLLNLAAQLDRGMPEGWQHLVHLPDTSGSTNVQNINVQDLNPALDAWGLPDSIRGQAHNDVLSLIDLHASESTFVSQNFLYNVPGCNGGELPVCLHTLMVVVRRQPVADSLNAVNIWHVFMASNANAIQQFNYGETCHSCSLFFECCHDTQDPRDFEFGEMDAIQAVLSTSQATWAYDHLPTDLAVLFSDRHFPTRQSISSLSLTQDLLLPELLRRFVDNDVENKDVFRHYDDALLSTLQGSMHSTQKRTRSFSLSLKEQDLTIIDNLLTSCLQEAGVDMSVQQLWQHAQGGSLDKPFSLECQHIQQKRIIDSEPVGTCNKSATDYIDTQQSWVLLSPRKDTIDCIYMETTTEANHFECERYPVFEIPENHSPKPPQLPLSRLLNVEDPDLPRQGSIARWSIPQQDGRFSPVHYLSRWPAYSREVNKAAMDIVRFLSASAFLKTPVPHLQAMHSPVDGASPVSVHHMMDPATLIALGTGLGAIGDGWDKFSSAIFGSSSEKVTRQICLGFEKYEHSVSALKADSIPQEHFLQAVDALLQLSQVQPQAVEDLRKAMVIVEYSTNLTWSGETAQYTSKDGSHGFFFLYKHQDPKTNNIDIVFGALKADFKLAEDVLVIERKEVGPLGMGRDESVEFKGVPHDVTPDDAALLNKYFEVVAYRQLAPMLGMATPEYPTMPPCSKYFSSFFW